jgi:septum formation protein
MKKNILLLGSSSISRQQLLTESKIPFTIVSQSADESHCDWGLSLAQLVERIALHKMNHVTLPAGRQEGEYCFVLTADTLTQDADGTIQGKPVDRADAVVKIKKARNGSVLFTSFCLDKKVWKKGNWEIDQRIQKTVGAEFLFVIEDHLIDYYLDNSIGLGTSNAIAIEGFGEQFLKKVTGSYSTIIGLPMFEVRQALETLGFFL